MWKMRMSLLFQDQISRFIWGTASSFSDGISSGICPVTQDNPVKKDKALFGGGVLPLLIFRVSGRAATMIRLF
jgi:hypothetical protein